MGVAERLLLAQHLARRLRDVEHLGQVVEVQQVVAQPLPVRVGGGQLRLDLGVLDDPTLGRVDEEHAARTEATLLDHRGRVDAEGADLGRHDHQAVVADPVARRAQSVAVEHRAHDRAIGERHRGRTVPRLHDAGVEPVEVTDRRVHVLVVLPRLRDHHQHRVGQRVTAQVQQLQRLVQSGGVGRARGADREDALQLLGRVSTREQRRRQQRLTGPHPVLVALDRVDLAVVGDVAVRVGQRPGRERVGREPRVHDAPGPTRSARR